MVRTLGGANSLGRLACLKYDRLLLREEPWIYGTDRTLQHSIHVESAGLRAHRVVVRRSSPGWAATRGSPGVIAVGTRLSHCRRDDPGTRLSRRRGGHGVPDDD